MRAPILRAAWPLILLGSISRNAHADEHPAARDGSPTIPTIRCSPRWTPTIRQRSRFILSFFPYDLPVHPPESEGGPQEALSRAQMDDLLAFLQRL